MRRVQRYAPVVEPLTSPEPAETPSLLERMPDYLVTFGIGLGVSVLVGGAIWLFSGISLALTVGYTVILYGVVLALAGGSAGGGYTNLGMGAMGAMFGARRADEAQPEPGSAHGPDLHERLAKGLRPEANPRAFWQVMGGALYIAVGLAIVIAGS